MQGSSVAMGILFEFTDFTLRGKEAIDGRIVVDQGLVPGKEAHDGPFIPGVPCERLFAVVPRILCCRNASPNNALQIPALRPHAHIDDV